MANYADRFRCPSTAVQTRPVRQTLGSVGLVLWIVSAAISYGMLGAQCVSGEMMLSPFFSEACTNVGYSSNHLSPLIAVVIHLTIIAISTVKRLRIGSHSSSTCYKICLYFMWMWMALVIAFSIWARRPFMNAFLCWTGIAVFIAMSDFAMDFWPGGLRREMKRREAGGLLVERESEISAAVPEIVNSETPPPPTVPVQPIIVQVVEPPPPISEPSLAAYYELKDPDVATQMYSPIANEEPRVETEEELKPLEFLNRVTVRIMCLSCSRFVQSSHLLLRFH